MTDMTLPDETLDLNLPDEVLARAEASPVEDMIVHVIRTRLPSVPCFSLIPIDPPIPFILVRQEHSMGAMRTDGRLVFETRFSVNVYTAGPNGDEQGFVLSDAVRATFREAMREQDYVPGRGWIKAIREAGQATREADWATSAGPVQYADLPSDVTRWESEYTVRYRRDHHNNPYL